jgi:hypothetical protein
MVPTFINTVWYEFTIMPLYICVIQKPKVRGGGRNDLGHVGFPKISPIVQIVL